MSIGVEEQKSMSADPTPGGNCGTGHGGFKPGNTCGKSKKKYAFTEGSALKKTKLVDTSTWKEGHQSAEGYSKKIAVLDQMHDAGDWDELSQFVPPNPGNSYQKAVGVAWKKAVQQLGEKLGKSPEEIAAVLGGQKSKPAIVTPETAKPVLKAEDKVAPQPPSKFYDLPVDEVKQWKKVGEKLGTAPGGVYLDVSGTKHYVKFHDNPEQAAGEVLAARLYALAGAPVLDYHPLKTDDGTVVGTSTEFQDAKKAQWGNENERKAASAFFAIHAWLNNRDAIGAGSENPMDNQRWINGQLTTMDTGGAMMFSGLGSKKAFDKDASEWDTMRDSNVNPSMGKVFGKMTANELIESAKLLEKIQPGDVEALVAEFSPEGSLGGVPNAKLVEVLLARRKSILDKAAALKEKQAPESPKVAPQPTSAPSSKSPEAPHGGLSKDWAFTQVQNVFGNSPFGNLHATAAWNSGDIVGYFKEQADNSLWGSESKEAFSTLAYTFEHALGKKSAPAAPAKSEGDSTALHLPSSLAGPMTLEGSKPLTPTQMQWLKKDLIWAGIPDEHVDATFEGMDDAPASKVYDKVLSLNEDMKEANADLQEGEGEIGLDESVLEQWKPYRTKKNPAAAPKLSIVAINSIVHDVGLTATATMHAEKAAAFPGGPIGYFNEQISKANLFAASLPKGKQKNAAEWKIGKFKEVVKKLQSASSASVSTPKPQAPAPAAVPAKSAAPVPAAIPQPPSVSWGSTGVAAQAKNKLAQLYNAAASGGVEALEKVKLAFHKNNYGKTIHAYKAALISALNSGAMPAVASVPEAKQEDIVADVMKSEYGTEHLMPESAAIQQSASAVESGAKLAKIMEDAGFVKNGFFVNEIKGAADPQAKFAEWEAKAPATSKHLFAKASGKAHTVKAEASKIKPIPKSQLPPAPEFQTSNMANKAANQAEIAKLQAIAAGEQLGGHGDVLAALQAAPQSPSPKVNAYKSSLIAAVKGEVVPVSSSSSGYYGGSGAGSYGHTVLNEIASAKSLNPSVLKESHLPAASMPSKHVGKKIAAYLVLGSPKYDPGLAAPIEVSHAQIAKIPDPVPMPSDVAKTISHYTGSGSGSINTALRTGKASKSILDIATKATKSSKPLPAGTYVSRGLTIDNPEELMKAHGQVISEPGYTSTALNGTGNFGGNVLWQITTAPGARAIHAKAHSSFSSENEILFPPNQRYFIHKVIKDGSKYVVFATALPTLDSQCCEAA